MSYTSSNYCKETVQYDNNGQTTYCPCSCPVKYIIEYISPINGKETSSFVCGRHFRAVQKNSESIKRRTGFDTKFTFKKC